MSKKLSHILKELAWFTWKEARACVFAGSFFVLLWASHHIQIPGLARYDLLFLGSMLIQIVLVATKLETEKEVKVIFLFHIVGLCLELFKTHPSIGSWSYPEYGVLKIGTVPLYSGFMYAAVGSYISQAWKLLDLRMEGAPAMRWSALLGVLIYLNFFTHHFFVDLRYVLMLAVVALFWKTRVYFTPHKTEYHMPVVLSFFLIAFFIWIAENISTFLGAWKYPDQLLEWSLVSLHKVNAWSLLVIISFILIANLKRSKRA